MSKYSPARKAELEQACAELDAGYITVRQFESWKRQINQAAALDAAKPIDNSPEAVAARKAMFRGFGWGVSA